MQERVANRERPPPVLEGVAVCSFLYIQEAVAFGLLSGCKRPRNVMPTCCRKSLKEILGSYVASGGMENRKSLVLALSFCRGMSHPSRRPKNTPFTRRRFSDLLVPSLKCRMKA